MSDDRTTGIHQPEDALSHARGLLSGRFLRQPFIAAPAMIHGVAYISIESQRCVAATSARGGICMAFNRIALAPAITVMRLTITMLEKCSCFGDATVC